MHSMAVATPSSCRNQTTSERPAIGGDSTEGAHLADLLAGEARALNLLLVRDSRRERIGKVVDRKVADVRADAEGRDTVRVEVLIAEEGLDDRRKASCEQSARQQCDEVEAREGDKPRRLAPVVPAPPWWTAALMRGKSQSYGIDLTL